MFDGRRGKEERTDKGDVEGVNKQERISEEHLALKETHSPRSIDRLSTIKFVEAGLSISYISGSTSCSHVRTQSDAFSRDVTCKNHQCKVSNHHPRSCTCLTRRNKSQSKRQSLKKLLFISHTSKFLSQHLTPHAGDVNPEKGANLNPKTEHAKHRTDTSTRPSSPIPMLSTRMLLCNFHQQPRRLLCLLTGYKPGTAHSPPNESE